jgi:hypothetical protein
VSILDRADKMMLPNCVARTEIRIPAASRVQDLLIAFVRRVVGEVNASVDLASQLIAGLHLDG